MPYAARVGAMTTMPAPANVIARSFSIGASVMLDLAARRDSDDIPWLRRCGTWGGRCYTSGFRIGPVERRLRAGHRCPAPITELRLGGAIYFRSNVAGT